MSSRRMKRAARAALLAVLALPLPASAFKLGTSFTPPCHERLTYRAMESMTLSVPELHTGSLQERFRSPESEPEQRLAAYFRTLVGEPVPSKTPESELDELRRGRVLNSFFIGVRYPDVEGLDILELGDLREIHLSPVGQEAHFLRAHEDDGEEGNAVAVATARRYIVSLIDQSKRSFDESPAGVEVETWVEHYGRVKVPVIEAAFLLGQALHALQDSFTHAYRSEDLTRIHVLQTYLDALGGDYEEPRDGPRHSDFLDDCSRGEVAPVQEAAAVASSELVKATQRYWLTGNRTEVDAVLARWLDLEEGCEQANGYCDSPWVELGRRGETQPALACATVGSTSVGALLLVFAAWQRRRRRWREG